MGRSALSIGLLGPLRISADDRVLGPRDLGGRKPKQVLEVLLVHQGQPVAKERIADLVWHEHLPKDPMRTLEAYVSGLRDRLSAVTADPWRLLRSEPGAYRLALEEVVLDLHRFDALVAEASTARPRRRMELGREGLGLFRGDLLADEPYAEWAFPLRDLYAERRLQVMLDLAEDGLLCGTPEESARQAQQVLDLQPTRERAHRLLIAARYACGEQAAALRAYERCRVVLRDELGVDPLPVTGRLHRSVLDQVPVATLVHLLRPAVPWSTRQPRPVTRFARNGDTAIAYQVLGEGAQDLVFAHAWFSHMEIGWEEPRYSAFLHRLAQGRRLIIFDRRGMGMSDPAPPTVTLQERAADILAVMDAAGSARAVVLGSCGSGPAAITLAAGHRDRVTGLILFGTFARMLACPDYPAGWSSRFFAQYKAGLEQGWYTGRGISRSVPTAGDDEQLREWLSRLLRLSATPAAARAILDFGATIDVRDLLPAITVPTLVLHRRNDQWVHPDNGRYLAEHIPSACFELLEGADHWPWFGDAETVLERITRFATGLVMPADTRTCATGRP